MDDELYKGTSSGGAAAASSMLIVVRRRRKGRDGEKDAIDPSIHLQHSSRWLCNLNSHM